MNTAMKLYSEHFHGQEIQKGKEALLAAILIRNDFKSERAANRNNGHEKVTFDDNSKLIFTHDNVQVSLF